MLKTFWLVFLSLFGVTALHAAPPPKYSHQVIAYVFSPGAVLQPGQIDPHAVTRINYAFANIQDGRVILGHPNDSQNLALLTGLRKENRSLTILISVGGWLWSGQFSDAALTEQSRQQFIQSAIDFIGHYDLDGLDIDWEYPGMPGAGHAFRPEDGQNFNILLKELRARFNKESATTGRKLLLSIAAGAEDDYIAHTGMAEAQKYLDTVNLMAYDYYEPGSSHTTGHHAPLFTNPADPLKISADASVRAFRQAGVPAEKLVLGVPFYGHLWGEVNASNHGLYQPGKAVPNAYSPFSLIESTMLSQDFVRYWDPVSSAPYLYSSARHIFVSYEDEQSLAAKCHYVLAHKLGGVMFWDYSNDSDGKLLKTIDSELLHPVPQPGSHP